MLYQLGHEGVDTAAGRAGTPHTHTHLQRSRASTVNTLYTALLLPVPTAQGCAGTPYSTLLPVPTHTHTPESMSLVNTWKFETGKKVCSLAVLIQILVSKNDLISILKLLSLHAPLIISSFPK